MQQQTFRLLAEPEGGMEVSALIPKESFTTDDQHEVSKSFFESADESVSSGVWECAPCRKEIESYPVNEMMTIISGSVTLTHADGRAETFTAGDVFFVSKGTKCTWHVTETLRKFYMIAA
ncbi:MAG: cupin domain-containing protein [Pseudomonadota bacterium]